MMTSPHLTRDIAGVRRLRNVYECRLPGGGLRLVALNRPDIAEGLATGRLRAPPGPVKPMLTTASRVARLGAGFVDLAKISLSVEQRVSAVEVELARRKAADSATPTSRTDVTLQRAKATVARAEAVLRLS